MIVRAYKPSDRDAIEKIHARMGMDYRLPDLEGPDASYVQVVEEYGMVIGASMNRVIAESYVWIDPTLDPRDKFTAIRLGQAAMLQEARKRGWRECIAMIPEFMEKKFQKRLKQLHWSPQRDGWNLWGREVSR
jgi:hypothetical protein